MQASNEQVPTDPDWHSSVLDLLEKWNVNTTALGDSISAINKLTALTEPLDQSATQRLLNEYRKSLRSATDQLELANQRTRAWRTISQREDRVHRRLDKLYKIVSAMDRTKLPAALRDNIDDLVGEIEQDGYGPYQSWSETAAWYENRIQDLNAQLKHTQQEKLDLVKQLAHAKRKQDAAERKAATREHQQDNRARDVGKPMMSIGEFQAQLEHRDEALKRKKEELARKTEDFLRATEAVKNKDEKLLELDNAVRQFIGPVLRTLFANAFSSLCKYWGSKKDLGRLAEDDLILHQQLVRIARVTQDQDSDSLGSSTLPRCLQGKGLNLHFDEKLIESQSSEFKKYDRKKQEHVKGWSEDDLCVDG